MVALSGLACTQCHSTNTDLQHIAGLLCAGTAFMPCMVTSLGADAGTEATAAARVLHVLRGGLETGLWTELPAAGHAQRAAQKLSARLASVNSLKASLILTALTSDMTRSLDFLHSHLLLPRC